MLLEIFIEYRRVYHLELPESSTLSEGIEKAHAKVQAYRGTLARIKSGRKTLWKGYFHPDDT